MLRFHFNPAAFSALAKEIRRASWGVAIVMGGVIYKDSAGSTIAFGGAGWLLLQIIAFAVESIKSIKGDQK